MLPAGHILLTFQPMLLFYGLGLESVVLCVCGISYTTHAVNGGPVFARQVFFHDIFLSSVGHFLKNLCVSLDSSCIASVSFFFFFFKFESVVHFVPPSPHTPRQEYSLDKIGVRDPLEEESITRSVITRVATGTRVKRWGRKIRQHVFVFFNCGNLIFF